MAHVALRGLVRRHPGAASAALAGLDLEIDDGELVVIVGPSGCGKSTVLRLVAGLDVPDAGSILIDGHDVSRVPPQDRDVAMVFQGYALYPHLTAGENIAFPLKMRRIADAERSRRVREAAATLGLSRLLERRPSELSGGERQRVAMGRAIVRNPKVFLFDEPLSNLDAALRAELRIELVAIVRRLKTTSVYVTHDQVEAMTMADRIAVLRGGMLQQIDTPRAVYEDPANAFVAGFLGSPPINWIELARVGDRFEGAGGTWLPPPGMTLSVHPRAAVRPECVRLGGEHPGIALAATVEALEPLGAETHVLLDAAGTKLRAKVPGFEAPARGAVVQLSVPYGAVLWFDSTTGERLRLRGASA